MTRPVRAYRGESVFHSIMETSPRIVVVVHMDGRIGYVNPTAERALGYRLDELVGQPVEVLVPANLAGGHVQRRTQYAADPHPEPMAIGRELAARRKDGSEFPVEIGLTPLPAEDGPWVLATVADLTARRNAAAQLQAVSRSYRMLAHTNQAIVRAASIDALYVEVCRVVVDEGGYSGAWVAQPRPSGDLEMVATAGELDDYIASLRITIDEGRPGAGNAISLAMRENRPVYVDEAGLAEESGPTSVPGWRPGIEASASLPLWMRGRVVAVLTLYAERAEAFDDETRALLQGMADNISFGLAGFAAAIELDRTAAKSEELVRRLVRAQEDERNRIAADVHDDSVQSLAVVDLRLGLLLRRLEARAPELTEAVAQIQETVGRVSAGLRLLLFELESTDSTATLLEMLTEAAGVIFEGHDVRWSVEVDAPPELADVSQDADWLPEPNRTQVVRVAKEALVNVRKHSGARTVSLTIRPDQHGVEVSVVDDGVGIDAEQVRPTPGHRGLTTMRERVEIGGGWTQIDGGPNGTSLRFWMPRLPEGDGHTAVPR